MAASRIPYAVLPTGVSHTGWKYALSKFFYKNARFNQYGLMRDDLIMETSDVEEALRRLPSKLYDERVFRISRAMNLSCQRAVLPKDQWTTLETDVRYLKPYLDEIHKERAEQAAWFKGNIQHED